MCQDSVIPSPVNGVVAQKLVSAGELVAAGQKLFTLVNTDDIWLNARIEETRIGQIRVGQDVTFTIDGYPGRTFSGRIYEINPAACSVFSLISTENVAGYFTKIMQRVPVKISLPRLDSPETDPGEPEAVGTANVITKRQGQYLGVLTQPPNIRLITRQTSAVNSRLLACAYTDSHAVFNITYRVGLRIFKSNKCNK